MGAMHEMGSETIERDTREDVVDTRRVRSEGFSCPGLAAGASYIGGMVPGDWGLSRLRSPDTLVRGPRTNMLPCCSAALPLGPAHLAPPSCVVPTVGGGSHLLRLRLCPALAPFALLQAPSLLGSSLCPSVATISTSHIPPITLALGLPCSPCPVCHWSWKGSLACFSCTAIPQLLLTASRSFTPFCTYNVFVPM